MSKDHLTEELLPEKNEKENIYLSRILQRVEELINTDLDLLFSYLYRLDIEEHQIQQILRISAPDKVSEGLAKAIWDRQKQRLHHKSVIKVPKIKEKGWEF